MSNRQYVCSVLQHAEIIKKEKKTPQMEMALKVLISHLKGQLQQCLSTSLPKTVVAKWNLVSPIFLAHILAMLNNLPWTARN